MIAFEARAALAAAARGARISSPQHRAAKRELALLVDALNLVEVTADLIDTAGDLAEREALRGYDAVHLAAALSVEAEVLTSADTDLCAAAARRGMHIANPLDG